MTGAQRTEFAELVLKTALAHADGYRRAVSQFDEYAPQAEACACAVSNTGYMILRAMGYSGDEVRAMADRIKQEDETENG